MCYSALVWADYLRYVRTFQAQISVHDYHALFVRRAADPRVKIPKAIEDAFLGDRSESVQEIQTLIEAFRVQQAQTFEQDLFAQRRRLADAQRKLLTKTTKAALNDQRIATDKVDALMGRLADLRRDESQEKDSRIYPGQYAPVMVMESGRRVIKPMRYQCRPAGKPAAYDVKYPGTYNARRDNLEGFWRDLFGYSHGVMVVDAFFENVSRHKMEHRELQEGEKVENVVLEFRPEVREPMLVACLWSRWNSGEEPDLLSFAAITDEPPAEVSAAGHDRCIVPIKPEHIDAWLSPNRRLLRDQYAILDDRERPYYEHRLAA